MHPNPAFHTASRTENLAFARDRGFGVLSVAHEGVPLVSHIPFVLDEDGAAADLHLVRSNPIARALGQPLRAVLAVSGPDGYVSPDWYGLADQVPTWNYVAAHLAGRLERLPDAALRDQLDGLSRASEARLAPKPEWRAEKMDAEAMARMMRQIVPCRLHVEAVDGTWKLSQNKPEAVRIAAVGHVEQGAGQELAALARMMRDA